MLLYNVTVILEDSAAGEWLQWMQETHIPQVMATGKFVSNRLLKVLDSPNEGQTFCAQYVVEDLASYEAYKATHSTALQADMQARFENRFVAFRTLMQYVD